LLRGSVVGDGLGDTGGGGVEGVAGLGGDPGVGLAAGGSEIGVARGGLPPILSNSFASLL
jgi:hypothetical protein